MISVNYINILTDSKERSILQHTVPLHNCSVCNTWIVLPHGGTVMPKTGKECCCLFFLWFILLQLHTAYVKNYNPWLCIWNVISTKLCTQDPYRQLTSFCIYSSDGHPRSLDFFSVFSPTVKLIQYHLTLIANYFVYSPINQ
jgi:hypothetical protein